VLAGESILFNYGRNTLEEDAIDLGSSICSRDAGMRLTDAGHGRLSKASAAAGSTSD